MTPPHRAPENAPAAAAEDNHFDGDAPRGDDDRPAPLDACGDQGVTVSTTALSEYGPVITSILAAEAAP
jgi:hypothetical protein